MSNLLKVANAAYSSMRYDGSLEKTALRAWKANFGCLGAKSKQLLQSAGILDHTRELNGLNTGSANIINRYGGKITCVKPSEVGKTYSSTLDSEPHFKAMIDKGLIDKDTMVNSVVEGAEFAKGHVSSIYGKVPSVNKGYGVPDALSTGNAKHNDYISAIMHRHEADELRFARTAMKDPRKNVDILGGKSLLTAFGHTGHVSPKVIAQESAHVAIAPESIKNTFHNARTNLDDGVGEGKAMAEFATKNMKRPFEYSQSGRVDKSLGSKMERAYISANKPNTLKIKQYLEN